MRELLSAQELAEALQISVDTIWTYTQQGMIPVVQSEEKQLRYDKEAVLSALVMEGSVNSKPNHCTYEDYLNIPEEPGYRYEILGGILIKDPSPSLHHQRLSRELGRQLLAFFDHFDPQGELFFAPLDVTLTDSNVLQPDIVFVSSARKGIKRNERIDGPCDLVVEIMSPSSLRKDRIQKMEIYRRAGIPHYWLVDSEGNRIEAYLLRDDNYILAAAGGPGDRLTHPQFPGLGLDLKRVFQRPTPE